MNRYYSNAYGRFMTPDPYQASGGPTDPQSWNRYAYVNGDPVNTNDTVGLAAQLFYAPSDIDTGNGLDGGGDLFVEGPDATTAGLDPGLLVTWNVFLQIGTGGSGGTSAPAAPPSPACGVTLGMADDYICLQTFGAQWNAVASVVRAVENALQSDPTCEKWLSSTMTGGLNLFKQELPYLTSDYAVAAGFIDAYTGAADDADATVFDVKGYLAIINYSTFSVSSASYNRDTILHELAHIDEAKGFIKNDGEAPLLKRITRPS